MTNIKRKYQVIKVPTSYGSPCPGTDQGPEAIISSLEKEYAFLSENILEVRLLRRNSVYERRKFSGIKNLSEVTKVCLALKKQVASVCRSGKFPLVFLGDDSSVIGVGYGLVSVIKKPFGLIYFDAHGDLNTPSTSPSGCLFGMGLAHLFGWGHPDLLALGRKKPAIKHENLIMIGQRDLDPGEVKLIKRNKIAVYPPVKLKNNLSQVFLEIRKKFTTNDIYIHFDQDVIDPKESGASLCPVKHGLSSSEFYKIIRFFKNNFNIVAVSIGNYLPAIDKKNKTLKVILKFLEELEVIEKFVA